MESTTEKTYTVKELNTIIFRLDQLSVNSAHAASGATTELERVRRYAQSSAYKLGSALIEQLIESKP